MSAAENGRLIERSFAELENGDLEPFVDAMADDVRSSWRGTMNRSRTPFPQGLPGRSGAPPGTATNNSTTKTEETS